MPLRIQQVFLVLWVSVLSLALYFSGLFVFWTPLPLLYLSLRRNKIQWSASFLLTLFGGALFYFVYLPQNISGGDLFAAMFLGSSLFAYYCLIAFLLSLGVWRHWPLVKWGAYVGLLGTGIVLSAALLCQHFQVFDIRGFLQQIVQAGLVMLDQTLASPSMHADKAAVATVVAEMKQNLQWMPRLLPSFLFIFTIFIMVLNLSLLKLLYRISKYLVKAGDFRRFRLFDVSIWFLIVSGGLFFANEYYLHLNWLKLLALNLLVVVVFAYFMQGVSILSYFLRRYSPLFRFGIYGLVLLFFQMLGLVVVGLGLADTWFDFRKIQKQKQKQEN